MAKFCPECGNELAEEAAVCVKCGKVLNSGNVNSANNSSNPNNGKKSNVMAILGFIFAFLFAGLGLIFSIMGLKKSEELGKGRGLSIAGIIIASLNMLLGIIFAMTGVLAFNNYIDSDINKNIHDNKNIINTRSNNDSDYTLGDTFTFDGLEITLDKEYTFVTVNNQYSEYNNKDVVKIGANVKNISDEKNYLNMFYYSLFGSKGTKLSRITAYFDESIDYAGKLKPGASYYKYFYILYDGDGEYSIDFDNYSDEIEVEFNVIK